MVRSWLEERERCNGKAPMEVGDDSSTDAVFTLLDSDSVGSVNAVQSMGDAKSQSETTDLTSERQNQQVLDEELSRLLSIFPNASPPVAAADLASQLQNTSPEKASERVIHRYVEHGPPKANQGPHEGPKPDPPQAIEKPMDLFARPNVRRVGTSNHGKRQVEFGYDVLPAEIEANYNLWTYYTLAKEFPRYPIQELKRVLHENNRWFAPSYKAISSNYTAALAAELGGQGRRRGERRGYPKLNMLPRGSAPKPHEPCYIFERELQSIQNASAKGAKLITEELKIDTGPQCGTHMGACEGETSAGRRCACCGIHVRFDWECARCMDRKCACCGPHTDSSECETSSSDSETSSSESEAPAYTTCGCCGTHMDVLISGTFDYWQCACCIDGN